MSSEIRIRAGELYTKNDVVGVLGKDFLLDLASDTIHWTLLRIKSTVGDPSQSVKQCLVNAIYTPTAANGSTLLTFSDMTSSDLFADAAASIRHRDGVSVEIVHYQSHFGCCRIIFIQ